MLLIHKGYAVLCLYLSRLCHSDLVGPDTKREQTPACSDMPAPGQAHHAWGL
jgi:hypothetical protein